MTQQYEEHLRDSQFPDMTYESLTKARDCAKFAVRDLIGALGSATALEALAILPMIERARALGTEISALMSAKEADLPLERTCE